MNAPDDTMLVAHSQTLGVDSGMQGGFSVIDDTLLQGTTVIVANSNLLRVKDDGRQSKRDRNEKALEFQ